MIYTTPDFSPALPLNHPRIGYQNVLRDGIAVASSQSGQNTADAVLNGLTWDFWMPSNLPATLTFTLPEIRPVNYFGIAAHTLGTDGATVLIEQWVDSWWGAGWAEIATITPEDDTPILLLFNTVESDTFRITVSGPVSPSVGVVYAGIILEMERRMYQGHSPINLSRRNTIRPQRSEGGQWLGRSVIRKGAQTNISFSNLSADWVRTFFRPFMRSAVKEPFFFAWRGAEFPKEVGYCWTNDDIVPVNSGPRDLMSVSFAVDGIVGEDGEINETTE